MVDRPASASGRLTREQTEEIVEKKPTAPMAVALLIISTVAIILGIYLQIDWFNLYYRSQDWEGEEPITAEDRYKEFEPELVSPDERLPEWVKQRRGQ